MNVKHNSIYSKDINNSLTFDKLNKDVSCDIAIIGGGFTGLSAAINLAETGYKVSLFEKEFIGYGCSGRNGGHLVQGWSSDFSKIQNSIPKEYHKMAWDAGIEAVDIVLKRIKKYKINCDLKLGYVYAALHKRQLNELETMKAEWEAYGYKGLTFLKDKGAIKEHVNTEVYIGGLHDKGSGHLHPMKYLKGLSKVASDLGVNIYEKTFINKRIDGGKCLLFSEDGNKIEASSVLLCGNAYLEGVSSKAMTRKLARVTSSVMATSPVDEKTFKNLIPNNAAIADCNTALNYYRFDYNKRMIFGGRSSYTNINPKDVTNSLMKKMVHIFPSLENIDVEMAWSGKIGITISRIPHFGKINKNVYFAQGYSGHGVALTALAGNMMAEAIRSDTNRFEILSQFKHMTFPGGFLRTPVLALGMSWFKIKDWLKI